MKTKIVKEYEENSKARGKELIDNYKEVSMKTARGMIKKGVGN